MASPLFPHVILACVGILMSRCVITPIPDLLCLTSGILGLAWLSYFQRRCWLLQVCCLLTFCLLGILASHVHQTRYAGHHLKTLATSGKLDLSQPSRITGTCTKSSTRKNLGEQIEIEVDHIENGFGQFKTAGRVRLAMYYSKGEELPSSVAVTPGEYVQIFANLKLPKNFNNPGQFDYVSFLEREGVVLVGTVKHKLLITHLATDHDGILSLTIRHLRNRLVAELDRLNDCDSARSIMKALLLGDKQSLSPQLEKEFQAVGLYHVLVISGQHIAIMAAFLLGFLRLLRIPSVVTLVLTSCGLTLYAALVEFQASVLRAVLMTCIFLFSLNFDRDRSLLNSVSLATGSLLLFEPTWIYDPGFQLSMSAVLAIALIALPILNRTTRLMRNALSQLHDPAFDAHCDKSLADLRIWLRLKLRVESKGIIRKYTRLVLLLFRLVMYLVELLVVSVSIQLVFCVLMQIYFHRVSLLAPLLNLLAVPLVGAFVPLGLLLLLFSIFSVPGQLLLSECCVMLANALAAIATHFSSSAWGNLRVPTPRWWMIIIYFGLLVASLWPGHKSLRYLAGVLALTTLGFMILIPFPPGRPQGTLQLITLDVRQGDSIFLGFPDGSNLVIDGGGLLGLGLGEHFGEERFDIGDDVVSPFLWSQQIRRIDALVLTHAHRDHMGGLQALLENFDVGELWVGQNPMVPEYANILKAALRHSVPIRIVTATDSMVFHSAYLEFLNPIVGSNRPSTPSNNDSVAFRLQWGNRRFLLTGDIEHRIETRLLQNNEHISAEVLKVAHHGSRSSTSSEFIDSVNPLWALISVSENSPFGHPHVEVIERLDKRKILVFRTDRDGAITVTTDGNKLEVQTFLSRI